MRSHPSLSPLIRPFWSALMALGLATHGAVWAAGPMVPVITLGQQAVSTGTTLDGVVEPVRQATVSAQASGRIASLKVRAGDKVRAGQVIAVIDDREARTGVDRSQAQLAQAEAELANARAAVQRQRDLRAQGFVSQAALDAAEAQFKAAQAGRDSASAGTRQAGLAQSFTQVTAPFDGVVTELQAQAGDLAMPGKPLLLMHAPQPLRVVVQLPASMAPGVRAARQVQIEVPQAQGAAQWVSPSAQTLVPAADPVSQTMGWRLDLPAAAAQALMAGQQTRVRLAGAPSERALIPASAVLRRGELTAVYVVQGGQFVLRAVRLGAQHGAAGVEVLAGLRAGESIAQNAVQAGLAGAQPAKAH